MQKGKVVEYHEFEVIGTDNPIQIPLNSGHITSIEIESFYYKPITTTNNNLLGVTVNNLNGRYNSLGFKTSTIKTFPIKNGVFDYQAGKDELINLISNDCQLSISFINKTADKSSSLNPSYVVFDNNYLLNFSLLVEK